MRILEATTVAQDARRQGIRLALTASLRDLARSRECYGMWVDIDNAAAHATYRVAGGQNPELCDVVTWTFRPA